MSRLTSLSSIDSAQGMARRILPNHLDDLRRSGLSDATIESWGCFSIEQESASKLKPFGKGVTAPGLSLPMMAPGSLEPVGFSYKPDNPRVLKRNGKEHTLRYELPRRGLNRIHVPRAAQYLFRPPDGREGPMRMVITEGQKKAEKAKVWPLGGHGLIFRLLPQVHVARLRRFRNNRLRGLVLLLPQNLDRVLFVNEYV